MQDIQLSTYEPDDTEYPDSSSNSDNSIDLTEAILRAARESMGLIEEDSD